MAASRRRFDKHATHFRPGTTSSRRNAFAPISGLQNPPDAIIAVMGKTGSGKSSFISKLAVDDYVNAVGHKLKSETQNVYEVSCVAGGHNILLIDTPGFDDTNAETGTILKRIADWLQEYSHEKKLLNGLIYCHDITDSRFGGSSVKNLTLFEKLTGQDSMKNVVLLSTKWDGIDQETGEQRDQELKSTPSFWKIMLADGAKALRHNGTKTSAEKVVLALLNRQPAAVRLQIELAQGKRISETAAGAYVDHEIIKLQNTHRDEMNGLKEQIADAEKRSEFKFSDLVDW
ncbi:P-loop containing nucleoside triphosphate hydrolase protein [Dendryphion nanum]|uniref:P-loop containing nucleoside triphosphate hydrolase protein n=1 Tax=Dendryphion nanum TaxID=256645 RepID=A0A9P9EJX3_9PLEO|nr:P-loop containing nucleoside triphosphate hydrolase protein [Dendryphion nanum]